MHAWKRDHAAFVAGRSLLLLALATACASQKRNAPPLPEPPAVATAALVSSAAPSAAPNEPADSDARASERSAHSQPLSAPVPLVATKHPVDWWFTFKFNAATFPGCEAPKSCPFGGTPQKYATGESEQFAVAASDAPQLQMHASCLGEGSADDPLGSTFAQVYDGSYFYVLWNDQFYRDPRIAGCSDSCGAPWGHSKGMLAWNSDGEGVVLQVSTPSWPASGSKDHPRSDGNTLGCVHDDNVLVSQHFFALRLTHPDLLIVLAALGNASVATDPNNPQVVRNGGPDDAQRLVQALGRPVSVATPTNDVLSSGVRLLSKPSALRVPPWQMVSALLGGAPLRTATWWESHKLPSVTAAARVTCWDNALGQPGAVQIATSGNWQGASIGFKGSASKSGNHAKIGVGTAAGSGDVILGDMNQEGSLSGNCTAAQNQRGGLFFVVTNTVFHDSMSSLLAGESAPE